MDKISKIVKVAREVASEVEVIIDPSDHVREKYAIGTNP